MKTNKNIIRTTDRREQFYKTTLKIREAFENVQHKMYFLSKRASDLLGYDVTAELTATGEIEFRRNDIDDFDNYDRMTVMDVVNQINN